MEIKVIALVFTLCVASWDTVEGRSFRFSTTPLNRYSFPPHFDFGVASSAYQYEGAAKEGGRTQSIWDNFTHAFPERTSMDNGDVAVDFYHRYKEDVQLMKGMNIDSFRFSLSWSRILPSGKLSDGVNKEGVQFYKNLIDELIKNGIKPFITIYHWDIPQALDDEYGSFLSPRIIDDFRNYARFCFQEFGDKVSMWTTFNEPYVYSVSGYDAGNKAMGRCSKWVNSLCVAGDSGTEPYLVSHHLLLAHAAAVEEFRKCDKISKDAKIGIVLSPYWFEPYDIASDADKEAVERALAFNLGWHLSPLVFGDYPKTIKANAGNRLPSFTKEQSMMVKNSFDFIGVNYYTARFVAHDLHVDISRPRFMNDQHLQYKMTNRSGDNISSESDGSKILWSYPEGFRKILKHIKNTYNNPTIYITENGFDDYENGTVTREEILEDTKRIKYHQEHLQELQKAITEDGCDVRGYFTWSLLDNFEWEHGYAVRFGLYYVDYADGLKRHAKNSAKWFKHFLQRSEKPMPMDLFKSVKNWWSALQMI
ncbi:PREDICTED: beta-glucosidase 31-like [Camelina sativa]|uniref:Beta-glucosidase 31-like n=1 Tax=Camelina sativa TaxID=90675 RepID=A0ABM0Y0G9_CAMSA|nr:PREDICTED: beta-glucosidase 31-like [Camelina sativa]